MACGALGFHLMCSAEEYFSRNRDQEMNFFSLAWNLQQIMKFENLFSLLIQFDIF
jgi:hypothetical protein